MPEPKPGPFWKPDELVIPLSVYDGEVLKQSVVDKVDYVILSLIDSTSSREA